jgi:hypothetical protein
MDLIATLAGIGALPDLLLLLTRIGAPAAWDVPPSEGLPPGTGVEARVARSGDFEWLALLGAPASRVATRLARARARAGRLTAVAALDPVGRELAIAIAVERTAVAVLPLDAPAPADTERLRRLLALPPLPGLGFALRLSEILESTDVGRRFFLAFRSAVDRMAADLGGGLGEGDRRALALVQLTRVLFLYFVQAKGWLDGRPQFLREAVDTALARGRRLHRDLFRPLFFGTLNRRPEDRARARHFGRVPFLNGGLFEPHPLERRWRGDIPNTCWREAFDQVFERFHFTVHEGADPGRIAPDMLGRVFEGLMAPTDRREGGAFYTPAALVGRLVDEALQALLVQRLGVPPGLAPERLASPDEATRSLFRTITVLDPAVGSGAFLLGALERLAGILAGDLPPGPLRRRILTENLFGVDLNPMAVRLAELRLWLAVIAVEDTHTPEAVAPLPNLDGTVRQGDTLLDPGYGLGGLSPRPGAELTELRETRRAFGTASGPEKRDLRRRLRQLEARACDSGLRSEAERLESEITSCLLDARGLTLFGEPRGLDRPLRRRLKELRRRAARVRRLRRKVRAEGAVLWFSCEVHFADVLSQGGFDVVIGNPPWVRAEHLTPEVRTALGQRYRWWRGNGRGFRHQPDLSLAFAERGTGLLAPSGILAFLLPAKVWTAGYARRMRAVLSEQFTLHTLADLTSDPVARFEATTYPTAVIAARVKPHPIHAVRLGLGPKPADACLQSRLTGGGPWVLLPPDLLEALALVDSEHPRIGSCFVPQLGVKTGANAVFLEPPAEIEPALIRLALRGRDLYPFRFRSRVRLFFPHTPEGAPYARLPVGAARHVMRHEALLRARVDYRGGPPWTLFRVRGALAPHRVAWPDLSRHLAAVPLTGPAGSRLVVLNSCYIMAVPDAETALALTAWLNCTWLRALARARADVAANGFARFNARVVSDLPLPPTVLRDDRLTRLAERAQRGASISGELDAICAEHLALPLSARDLLATAARANPDPRR